MNESDIDDIEKIEKDREIIEKAKNMVKIPLKLEEIKYTLKLYLSEEKNSIIFKLEQERTLTYFYFEKYFLHDFRQRSRIFMIDYSITQILAHLKKLIAKSEIILEKKGDYNMTVIIKSDPDEYLLNFEVKKIILAQNQLNPKLVEEIQENKAIVKLLKKQINKLSKTLQEKNDLINNLNTNITNINKTINEININNNNINNNLNNNINNNLNNNKKEKDEEKNININTNKKTEKKEEEKDKENDKNKEDNMPKNKDSKENNSTSLSNTNTINNKEKEKEKENKEIEDKRYISNNRKKKNKKKNKKIKFLYGDNQNKNNQNNNNKSNDDNSIFCFENVEIIGNKKIFELLVVFNVIMILIILCLIGSIYSIKSNIEYEKVLEEEFMNKLSYLNVINDYNDDDYGQRSGIGDWDQNDFLFENEQQKTYFKEEIISRENSKIKDIDFILKYKSSRDGKNFETFLNYCKGIEDSLLLIRNDRAQKFALLSKNIVEVLRGNKMKDFQGIKKNFVMYNFNRHDIFEYNFTRNFEEIYSAFIKTIFGFFTDKGDFEDRLHFLGRIVEIEIYELKYIK
jgi:hypothetical protein